MRYNKYAPYLYCKRGIYYFARRVPKTVQAFYTQPRIVLSLRTKSLRTARFRATQLAQNLDGEWGKLLWQSEKSALVRFRKIGSFPSDSPGLGPLLSEAQKIYLEQNLFGRPKTFRSGVERCVASFIELVEDKPIDEYSRSDVNTFRDASLERGMAASSVRRNINTLRALVNFVSREKGLEIIQCFSSIHIQGSTSDVGRRKPIPLGDISHIQQECLRIDDEQRWLIAILSDTGMRLSEAAGLEKEHVSLDEGYPFLKVRGTGVRRLKTHSSERDIPLVGAAFWGASRAVSKSSTGFLFPKYASETGINANSASASLNKWLRPRVPRGCVIHSFRHSFRDRLRAVDCPSEVIDQVGGWALQGVGSRYGSGYPTKSIMHWMHAIELQEGY